MNHDLRLSWRTEVAVNRGLALALLDGVRAGIEHMKKENVPLDVIYRVILTPSQRRDTDWRH
ncbi:MAG: hypothetical protein CVU34_14175 [Betaproteobacteria bacterium HGW-Betaproteobacteria-7]|jgi:hypothetical protein|nr:MAG: hypothetical protein CVU34_14175 [Betaproteobacteria bacterium HGW-Betaproteobacteria-7]